MQKPLREALARLWSSLWRGRGPVVAERDDAGSRQVDARARFWAEFREGQREADGNAVKSRL